MADLPRDLILPTKLYPPTIRPGAIPRPSLTQRLSAVPRARLILISAPAGYGKSTLTIQALTASSQPVAWLALDEHDNDATRFLAHLIAALTPHAPALAALTPLLAAAAEPQAQVVIHALLNALLDLTTPVTLVLDDYHVIETPAIHTALTTLLDHVPPTLRLVILTRADPPLPLSRWRVRAELLELRASDLRFTPSEAADFLASTLGLTLTPAQLAVVAARTEGWAAALQLAGLSLQGRTDIDAFLTEFTGAQRFLVDFLVDEVLHRLPPDQQQFLLDTALLERLCAGLCNAVTGRDDSQTLLEALDHANLFLIPLDAERRWYRYHHLFAEFLRHRLRTAEPAPAILRRYQRAAAWFEAAGLLPEAVENTLAGQDFDLAGELIAFAFRKLLAQGAYATLLGWYAALPPATLATHPDWQISYAGALVFTHQHDHALTLLDAAESALSPRADDPRTSLFLGWAAATRAIIAARQHHPTAAALAQRAFALLGENDPYVRGVTHLALALNHLNRMAITPALQELQHGLDLCRQADNPYMAAIALTYIGQLHLLRLDLNAAETAFQQALSELPTAWHATPVGHIATAGVATVFHLRGQYTAALRHFNQPLGLLLSELPIEPRLVAGLITHANTLQFANRPAEALALLDAVANALAAHDLTAAAPDLLAQRALTAYRADDPRTAFQWANQHTPGQHPAADLCWAKLLISAGQAPRALSVLAERLSQLPTEDRFTAAEAHAWLALAHQHLQQPQPARAALHTALAAIAPADARHLLHEAGPALAPLLTAAAADTALDAHLREYAADVVATFPAATSATPTSAALIEPLTEREREVLRLIDRGLTNQQIADRLVVSLATVKKHVSNLLLKLGADNRTQALTLAREYGLL